MHTGAINIIGRRATCSQLYGGKAVLLGDAGAPFSPIGQGINAAMESAMVFAQCFNPSSLHEFILHYNTQWKPEADAVSWISERMIFGNRLQVLRMVYTSKWGINAISNAKKSNQLYSEVEKQARRQWPLWAW